MTNTPIQITSDLSAVLERISSKLDGLQKELTDFKVEVGDFKTETFVALESVKGDLKTLDSKVSQTAADIKELKGSQKAQIWSLIVLAFTAVLGLMAALAKILFVPNF
jgi:hypothetical protein